MSAITNTLTQMSMMELKVLMLAAQREQEERVSQVKELYGELFCQSVGLNALCDLPSVEARSLNLQEDKKYPERMALPSLMPRSVVKGIMEPSNRPFIAIKVDILDPTTKKVVDVVVEVIFRLYTDQMDNYVTAQRNMSDNGKEYPSMLYAFGSLSKEEMQDLGRLLRGETISAPSGANYSLRMHKGA